VSEPRRPSLPGTARHGATLPGVRLPPGTPLAEPVVRRLRDACAEVRPATAADTRDWWPLSVQWATHGLAPTAAALVVAPRSASEVAAVLAICSEAGVPVTPGAGRSGVCGGAVPVFGGVVLDLLGMAGLTSVEDADLLVDALPGTWGDDLESTLRSEHGLTAGHWPQSIAISTVGGWVACRSAGQYSTRYGKIEDLVAGLDVVLADGTLVRTGGRAPRSATGPDLTQVFVGSEGILGVITSVRLRVRPVAESERRAAWTFPSFSDGLDACRRILRRGATPAVLRLYDPAESARHLPGVEGCGLLVLDEGDPGLTSATLAVVAEECADAASLEPSAVDHWLAHRNEVPSLAALAEAGVVADTVEVAAGWSALPGLYDAACASVSALDATLAVSAHQSHAYPDGACLYFTFAGRPGPELVDAERYYRAAWDAVVGAALAAGGTIAHHHGVGINRGRYLATGPGSSPVLLAALKAALDPAGILNPGKLGLASPWGPPPWP
jgi:alkyldihydroxyacetonephosphate synthase